MNKQLLTRLAIVIVVGLSGCSSNPSKQEIGTVGGAVVGGIVGASVTGGSTVGTVAGAVAGGYVGNVIGREFERR